MKIKTTLLGVILLALAAGQVSAQGKSNPKGPNAEGASVSVATVCKWPAEFNDEGMTVTDDRFFSVEIRVYNATSGDAIPLVESWAIDALAKTTKGNWSNQTKFAYEGGSGPLYVPLDPAEFLPIGPVNFALCVGDSLNEKLASAKALNAIASVTYGRQECDDTTYPATCTISQTRTIINMCSDDPNTDEQEPSGINLDFSTIACKSTDMSMTDATSTAVATSESTTEVIVTDTTTPDVSTSDTTTSDTATADAI